MFDIVSGSGYTEITWTDRRVDEEDGDG